MKAAIVCLASMTLSVIAVAKEGDAQDYQVEWQDVGIIDKPFTMSSLGEDAPLQGEVSGTVSIRSRAVEVTISSAKITCTTDKCRSGLLLGKVSIGFALPKSANTRQKVGVVDAYRVNRRLSQGETISLPAPQTLRLPFASFHDVRKLTLIVELSGVEGRRMDFTSYIHGPAGLLEGNCRSCLVSTKDGQSVVLEPDEAFIIVRARGEFKDSWFARVKGSDAFIVGPDDGPRLVRVKAGRYYLKSAQPVYVNFVTQKFDEPTDNRNTMEVRAGTVTYIGDWTFNWIVDEGRRATKFDLTYLFDKDTVEVARRKMNLDALPIFIARPNVAPVRLQATDDTP